MSDIEEDEQLVMNDEDDGLRDFYLPLSNGYSFRTLIDVLIASIINVRFVLTKDWITLCEKDTNETIMHRVRIATSQLVDYYLDETLSPLSLCTNLRDIKQSLRSAQKRTSRIVFFNNSVDETKRKRELYAASIQPGRSGGRSTIPLIDIPEVTEEMDESLFDYPDEVDNINEFLITLPVVDVSRAIHAVCNTKCDYVEIECYKRGFVINGYKDGNNLGTHPLGKCVDPTVQGTQKAIKINGPMICKYRIKSSVIKPYSKMNNISGDSATLRMFFSPSKNLKISFPYETSGIVESFIISVDDEPTSMLKKKTKTK